MNHSIEHLNQLASEAKIDLDVVTSVDLWVPGEAVLVFELELPKVSARKAQEMLPWMLEDRLLSPPESFEFVVGPEISGAKNDAGNLVYVIEKSVLSKWLMLAESAAVSPNRMAPDYLALPYEEDRWAVYVEEGRLLVRTGAYTGFAASLEFGWQQLQLLLTQLDEPVRLSFLQTSDIDIPDFFAGKLDSQTGKISWSFTELPVGINLLPARLKPKRSSGISQWWPAMASAAIFVLLLMTYMLVQSWVWQRDIAVLEEGVASSYEQIFSERLQGHATEVLDMGQRRMTLLEHQYIAMQSSPMAELTSLDHIFSSCTDCELMALEQVDIGVALRLKENNRFKSRLESLADWTFSWSPAGEAGYSRLLVEPAP